MIRILVIYEIRHLMKCFEICNIMGHHLRDKLKGPDYVEISKKTAYAIYNITYGLEDCQTSTGNKGN